MANVISSQDYLAIANSYAASFDNKVASSQGLFDAVYQVVLLNTIVPTVDLVSEAWNSYQINTAELRSPGTFLSFVRTLNNHVINRSTFSNIDDYLSYKKD